MRIDGFTFYTAGTVILKPGERAHLEFSGLSIGLRVGNDGGEARTDFDPERGDVLLLNFDDSPLGAFSRATLEFPGFGDVETRFAVQSIGTPPAAYSIGYTIVSPGN